MAMKLRCRRSPRLAPARRPAEARRLRAGPVRSRRHSLSFGLQSQSEGRTMDIVLLIVGVLLGAACAALLVRPNRGRMRDELTAISVDVLAQTGESLAQRVG